VRVVRNGSVNAGQVFQTAMSTREEGRVLDNLGGPDGKLQTNYPIGWEMRFTTPYKLFQALAYTRAGNRHTADISAREWAHGEGGTNYVTSATSPRRAMTCLAITTARRGIGRSQSTVFREFQVAP